MSRQVKKGKYAGLPWTGCPYCSHGLVGDNQDEQMDGHLITRHPNELRTSELEEKGGTPPPTEGAGPPAGSKGDK